MFLLLGWNDREGNVKLLKSIVVFRLVTCYPLDFIGRNRDLPLAIRIGLFEVLRLRQAFQLIFIRDVGDGRCIQFCSSVYSLGINCWNRKYHRSCDVYQVGGPGALFLMWMAAFFANCYQRRGRILCKCRTRTTMVR